MHDTFTPAQIRLATFRVGLENNALMRILIANQVEIMKKLGINTVFPDGAFADLFPDEIVDLTDATANLIKGAEPIAGLLQKRAWEWVHMNDAKVQNDDEEL